MILCPTCGSANTMVLDTRSIKTGGLRRRRECAECGGRCFTIEALEAVNQPKAAQPRIKKIAAWLTAPEQKCKPKPLARSGNTYGTLQTDDFRDEENNYLPEG